MRMRTWSRIGLALAAAVLAVGPTFAQGLPGGKRPGGVRPGGLQPGGLPPGGVQPGYAPKVNPAAYADPRLSLLGVKGVQDDLKLTKAQLKKLTPLFEAQKALEEALTDPDSLVDTGARARELQGSKKVITDLLTRDQHKRMRQLQVQQRGPLAFLDPKVTQDLRISREQQMRFYVAVQKSFVKMAEIARDTKGDKEQMGEKLTDLHKDLTDNMVKALSTQQQTKWHDLIGQPYKGNLPSPLLGVMSAYAANLTGPNAGAMPPGFSGFYPPGGQPGAAPPGGLPGIVPPAGPPGGLPGIVPPGGPPPAGQPPMPPGGTPPAPPGGVPPPPAPPGGTGTPPAPPAPPGGLPPIVPPGKGP
jgi:hypothetical protein